MSESERPVTINISTVRVAGVGGVGMLALAVVIAFSFPIATWLFFGGLAAGVVVGVALIVAHRRSASGPDGGDNTIECLGWGYPRPPALEPALRRRASGLRSEIGTVLGVTGVGAAAAAGPISRSLWIDPARALRTL